MSDVLTFIKVPYKVLCGMYQELILTWIVLDCAEMIACSIMLIGRS